ncbi:MAG: diphosphomevalonate decarboxylase [Chitinivibrionales bacterium]|nr:diphosphomevalonate decarboxylase [Chitinivibrionales bacterium]
MSTKKSLLHKTVIACAHPSLALTKYWGKASSKNNIPATSSLAITLSGLTSTTRISTVKKNSVVIVNGELQPPERYSQFFQHAGALCDENLAFKVESENDFPTGAGIASSSSGFAALACGIAKLADPDYPLGEISALARIGSGSAARSVFGGFTLLRAGSHAAEMLHDASFWPEFRIIVCIVKDAKKEYSSRLGMSLSKKTSPYFKSWVLDAEKTFKEACSALENKDIEKLGDLARISAYRMFGTMISSAPPLVYWEPQTIGLLKFIERLRINGIGAWETMDAGPQVKLICLKDDVHRIETALEEHFPDIQALACQPGEGASVSW